MKSTNTSSEKAQKEQGGVRRLGKKKKRNGKGYLLTWLRHADGAKEQWSGINLRIKSDKGGSKTRRTLEELKSVKLSLKRLKTAGRKEMLG